VGDAAEAGRMTYAEAIDARARLSVLAQELGARSGDLAHVSRELEATDEAYRAYVDEYEIGLWQRSQDEEGFKLPSEALRVKLAHKAMDPALLGRHKGLCASRDRLKQRIADLKAEIEAQRSILSALKTEMEATG
jgi:hypothetical protein